MPYYDTLEEDIKRAKEILAKGKMAEVDLRVFPEAMRDGIQKRSGTIPFVDNYAAYKLLESFVEELEKRK